MSQTPGLIPIMCAVFAHSIDDKHLLYVERSAPFPSKEFNKSTWRSIAFGVPAPEAGHRSILEKGYYEIRNSE